MPSHGMGPVLIATASGSTLNPRFICTLQLFSCSGFSSSKKNRDNLGRTRRTMAADHNQACRDTNLLHWNCHRHEVELAATHIYLMHRNNLKHERMDEQILRLIMIMLAATQMHSKHWNPTQASWSWNICAGL